MSNVQATLTFTPAIGGADYYEIENGFGSNISGASSPLVFNGLTSGTQYTFTAYTWKSGLSSFTTSVGPVYAGAPGAPSNLVSTPSYTQIELNWSQGTGITPAYYEISNITTGFNTSTTYTTYTQTSLSSATSYTYTVRGFGNQVFGLSSNVVTSTLSPGVLIPTTWYPSADLNFMTTGICIASDKNSNWVAGGGSGVPTILTSSNGSNWNHVISNQFTTYTRGVATDTLGRWVATGQDSGGQTIKYSTDNGSNWSNSLTGLFSNYGWCVATDNLGRWFVGGNDAVSSIKYSTNGGSNWSNVSSGAFTSACRGIATDGSGKWVAVGTSGGGVSIKYSTDNGLNWINSPTSPTFNTTGLSVAYKNGVWVATGQHLASGRTILYSMDGITWSLGTNVFSSAGVAVAVDNNGVWVAGGQDSGGNTIKYSLNGINWSNITSGKFTSACTGLAKNNSSLWVATGAGDATLKYSIAT
jgi:hypothetical protein